MEKVLPTPAEEPKKILRRPRLARASSALTWASSWSGSGRASTVGFIPTLFQLIEGKVEFQHVHPRLTDHSDNPAPGVLGDQCAHPVRAQAPDARNAAHLVIGRCEADVGIEAAAGGR